MAQRGRPPSPGLLTPAEERVLDHVRQGQTNAEIAVRLGISVNTVRYHVSNLLSKAGVSERAQLARWRPPTGERVIGIRRPGWWFIAAAACGVAALGVAGALWLVAPSGVDESGLPLPAGYRVYEAAELEAMGMVDAGPVFQLPGTDAPVQRIALREPGAALVLREGTQVVLRRDPCCSWGRGASFMLFQLDAQGRAGDVLSRLGPMSLAVFTGDGTTRLEFASPSERPRAAAGNGVAIVGIRVWKAGAGYIYGDGRRDALAAAVDAHGHLWVNPEPVDPDVPIDETTGRAMVTTDASLLASGWPGLRADYSPQGSNRCGQYTEHGNCVTSFYGRVTAPFAGRLTCEAGSSRYRLEGDGVVLVFSRVMDPAQYPRCTSEGVDREVAAGEEFETAAWWGIAAETPGGQPLDVARSYSGALYVGTNMAPDQTCPCVGSN